MCVNSAPPIVDSCRLWRALGSAARRGMLAVLLLLLAATLTPPHAHAAQQAMLESIAFSDLQDGDRITRHDMGIVRFEVRFATLLKPGDRPFRVDLERLQVSVNGQRVDFRRSGRGSGWDGDIQYVMLDLAIAGGPPGDKQIVVTYDDLRCAAQIDFRPSGQLELLALVDGQALFGGESTDLRWQGAYLAAESVRVRVNGRDRPPGATSGPWRELLQGTVRGALLTGQNTITFSARDRSGQVIALRRRVAYFPDNTLPQGTRFALPLGPKGSLSGPFFRARTAGRSLRMLDHTTERPRFSAELATALAGPTYLIRRRPVVLAWLETVARGSAAIHIEKKRRFSDAAWQTERTIRLRIGEK